jgi:hypothetical protein
MTSHPDPEDLSAYLDGDSGEWESHVSGCAQCRGQLDALRAVQQAVAAPVAPPAADRREQAIAAASTSVRPAAQPRVPRWAALATVGAVAAGVIVAAVVTTTGHRTSTTAASGPVSSNLVEGGDLGTVNDALALHAKLAPYFGTQAQTNAAAQTPFAPGSAGAGAGASGDSTGGTPEAATPKAATTVIEHAVSRSATGPLQCVPAARALQREPDVLVYVARATWQGTPADVLGFSPPGARTTGSRPAPTRVYVLARSDCHLLVFQSYAP